MKKLTSLKIYLIGGLLTAALSLFAFDTLAEKVLNDELKKFDNNVISFIWDFRNPILTQIMKFITFLGSAYVVVPVALLAFYYFAKILNHYWEASLLNINLLGGWLLNDLLKYAYQRPRLNISRLVIETGYSFPSGHSMIGATFYGFLAFIIYLNIKRPYKELNMLFFALLICLIGISRIYLGVHYPSDVLAGYLAGGAWLAACMLALQTIRYFKSKRQKAPKA